ncbi:GntR family transcriptional regulator [Amycolatopsis sp. NPDC059657]|uniref:GntR family transcriptional regulator n=1 Tax=Amycolatopsis sp. NPDC059657 TaxID=3346899 RepID=UPI00366D3247
MAEPAYVSIASGYARRIRSGELPAGMQLPSVAEIAEQNGVSPIVARKTVELLQNLGLVRTVQRRGVFVTSRPNLVRVSPEHQMQDAETTFGNESDKKIRVERETEEVEADEDVANVLGISPGVRVTRTVTRGMEDRRAISISDTYQPLGISGIASAEDLEEAVSEALPSPAHAEWLKTSPGDLAWSVEQKFTDSAGRVVMASKISYPRDRYAKFVFRMSLKPAEE